MKRIARGDHAMSERNGWRGRGTLRANLSRAVGALAIAAAHLALSTPASAQCELSQPEIVHGAAAAPTGIPEDAVMPIDVFGIRKGLARHGIEVGGVYYGEAFYNWGGFDQGGEYDGVLELYVKADMHKLGFWKGLCFHADGYQIHGNSITAANIGIGVTVVNDPKVGKVHVSDNLISGASVAGVAGMEWQNVVSSDLAADAGRYPHVTVADNSVA